MRTADSHRELQREVSTEVRSDIARRKANITVLSSYTVDVILNVGGCESVFRADVVFEFTRAERGTWDYPGRPAQAEVLHVMVGETDIVSLISREALTELAESLV
jgi:hypothetical protein